MEDKDEDHIGTAGAEGGAKERRGNVKLLERKKKEGRFWTRLIVPLFYV